MPRFRMNAPYPGGTTDDGRLVPSGEEFEVAADEPGGPHNMWHPVDASARKMFADWNKAHPDEPPRKPYPLNRAHLPKHLRDAEDPAVPKADNTRAKIEEDEHAPTRIA